MNIKFQAMKRNRSLWEELSERMRCQFGHHRTASQCSVRWKNLIASYKESRDSAKQSPEKARAYPFFKEVEAVLRDEPLLLPIRSHDNTAVENEIENAEGKGTSEICEGAVAEGKVSVGKREREHSMVMRMLGELKENVAACMSVLQTQGRLLERVASKLEIAEEEEGEISLEVTNEGVARVGVTGEVERCGEGEEMQVGEEGMREAAGSRDADNVDVELGDGQSHDRQREQEKGETDLGNERVEDENECDRVAVEDVEEEITADAEVVSDVVVKVEGGVVGATAEDIECEGDRDIEEETEGDVTGEREGSEEPALKKARVDHEFSC